MRRQKRRNSTQTATTCNTTEEHNIMEKLKKNLIETLEENANQYLLLLTLQHIQPKFCN